MKKNPALLQGHGETIADFDRILKAANRKVDETYDAYQGAAAKNETELATAFQTAEAERLPINETLDWLLGYAGYLEVEARFKRARILMFAAGIAAAAGIAEPRLGGASRKEERIVLKRGGARLRRRRSRWTSARPEKAR